MKFISGYDIILTNLIFFKFFDINKNYLFYENDFSLIKKSINNPLSNLSC